MRSPSNDVQNVACSCSSSRLKRRHSDSAAAPSCAPPLLRVAALLMLCSAQHNVTQQRRTRRQRKEILGWFVAALQTLTVVNLRRCNGLGPRHLAADAVCRARSSVRRAEKVRFGVRHGPSTRPTPSPRRNLHARKPAPHTRSNSKARSFDLGVTRWAPTRLTSCISHPGPEESSGASTWTQTAQARP